MLGEIIESSAQQGDPPLVGNLEVRLRVGPNLLGSVHQLRLGNPLHRREPGSEFIRVGFLPRLPRRRDIAKIAANFSGRPIAATSNARGDNSLDHQEIPQGLYALAIDSHIRPSQAGCGANLDSPLGRPKAKFEIIHEMHQGTPDLRMQIRGCVFDEPSSRQGGDDLPGDLPGPGNIALEFEGLDEMNTPGLFAADTIRRGRTLCEARLGYPEIPRTR